MVDSSIAGFRNPQEGDADLDIIVTYEQDCSHSLSNLNFGNAKMIEFSQIV